MTGFPEFIYRNDELFVESVTLKQIAEEAGCGFNCLSGYGTRWKAMVFLARL